VSESIDIRSVAEGDLEEVSRFRAAMQGGEYLRALRTPDYYRWKYLGAGGGLAMGAFRGERLLGLLSGLPRVVRVGEKAVRLAELGEIFVDPLAQGRGLFRALHQELLTGLVRRGVEAIGCRPAREAGEMLRERFSYQRSARISVGEHRIRASRVPRPSPGIEVEPETVAGPDYDGLETDLASGETATVRSAAWITARYLANPTPYTLLALRRGERLEGWLVLLAVPGERDADGYLVDWLVWPDPAVRRSAGNAAIRWFAGRGCRRVFAWRANGPQDPALLSTPSPTSRLRRLEYVLRPIRPTARALLTHAARSNWIFRMGDTDGI
jgi:GNAT superfamily N-acetyltransferase